MEGSFETPSGDMAGGPSMGGDSFGSDGFEGETVFESGAGLGEEIVESETPKMTGMDYLKEGVDKGFYEVETEGVFSMESVMSEAQVEMEKDEKTPDRQLMDIPGTPHEKLMALSQMSEEETSPSESSTGVSGQSVEEEGVKSEMTTEEKVMFIQSQALRFVANAVREGKSEYDKQEFKKLVKKIEALLEEIEREKEEKNRKLSKKEVAVSTTLSILDLMFGVSEKAINEVEQASKN